MDPPNNMLQAEHSNLLTAVQPIYTSTDCLKRLRCDEEFLNIWTDNASDAPVPAKRLHQGLQVRIFLTLKRVKPFLDLSNTEINETQFTAVHEFVRSQGGEPMTLSELKTQICIQCYASCPCSLQTGNEIQFDSYMQELSPHSNE